MNDSGKTGENDLLDFDNLFCNFLPEDRYFFDDHGSSSNGKTPNSVPIPYPSDNSASLSIGEIENLLLNDDFEDPNRQQPLAATDADAFLSDLLVDSPPPIDAGSDSAASFSPFPALGYNNAKDCSLSYSGEKCLQLHQQEEHHVGNNDDVFDDNDPIAKKHKRQLRNRDAAGRSRERKKLYVRDLEMKNRYYEAECKRLEWMLRYARAENQALLFALHSNRQAFGTSTTMQESAVLLLESLLLGSLLWLVGIIGLIILPGQLLSVLQAALLENVEEKNQTNLAPREVGGNIFGIPVFQSFMKSKRWRGSRTRMKVFSTRLCRCSMPTSFSSYEAQAKSFKTG